MQPETQDSTPKYKNQGALTPTLTLITTCQPCPHSSPGLEGKAGHPPRQGWSPTASPKPSRPNTIPSSRPPLPASHHLSPASRPHTWVLQGDVNLGPDDVVAFLQGVGRHCGPLAAGVDEQDVSLADALGIFPWEGGGGEKRKEEKGDMRRAREDPLTFSLTPFPSTAPPGPCPGQPCSGTDRRPAAASQLSPGPLMKAVLHSSSGLPAVPGPPSR